MAGRFRFACVCAALIAWGATAFAQHAEIDASKDPVGAELYRAVAKLAGRVGAGPEGGKRRVSVFKITHADLHFPSPASGYLRDRLETLVQDHFELISRSEKEIETALQEINATQGDMFDETSRVEPGRFLGCEFLLKGTYRYTSKRVLVHLVLVEPETMRKPAVSDAAILREDLPEDMSLEPRLPRDQVQQISEISEAPAPADTSFRLEVWPDKGDGATYREEELFYIRVRASKDCYLRLYHVDSEGQMHFRYPKPPGEQRKIQAGVVYRIPDATYAYRWRVCSPYGFEKFKAVASTAPFTDSPEGTSLGAFRSGAMRGLVTKGLREEALSAEASCAFETRGK